MPVAGACRRERGINQAVAQAAAARRGTERRHEAEREAWRRRLAEERWQREKMQGQLHATALAQSEFLSGLEVRAGWGREVGC